MHRIHAYLAKYLTKELMISVSPGKNGFQLREIFDFLKKRNRRDGLEKNIISLIFIEMLHLVNLIAVKRKMIQESGLF